MRYLGDIAEDATIRGSFNTRTAAGAPITLAGTPSLRVYKDAGTTESTAGVTLTVDFDGITGLHLFTIDTSADAFYATGSDYRVVIAAGTVDGTSVVGTEVGQFSIQNRNSGGGLDAAGIRAAVGLASANLDTQLGDIPTVAEFNARTLPSADYFVVSDYTAPPSAVSVASQVRTELTTELGRIDAAISTRLATSGYTAPDNASIAAILIDTNELQTNQGNWVTATGFSTHSASDVWAVATRTITGGTISTVSDKTGYSISGTITTLDALDTAQDTQHATTQAAISGLNNLSAAQVNAEVDAALADYDAPTKAELDAAFTEIKGATWSSVTDTLEAIRDNASGGGLDAAGVRAAIGLASANLDTQLADLPTVAEFSARTLPSADYFVVSDYTAPPTAAAIADAVWDEPRTGHTTNGTFGFFLDASVSGVSSGGVSVGDIADAVWSATTRTITGGFSSSVPGESESYAPEYYGIYLLQPISNVTLSTSGTSTFYIGDDYKGVRALSWSLASAIEPVSCHLAFERAGTKYLQTTGTVATVSSGVYSLAFDLDADDTGLLEEGGYEYSVEVRDASGNEITVVHSAQSNRRVARWVKKYT